MPDNSTPAPVEPQRPGAVSAAAPTVPRARIGLLWAQFSAYHVDRLEAVGRRLSARAHVVAVEVTSRSEVYAWEPSGSVAGTEKRRLFTDTVYESIPIARRFWAQLRALRDCQTVFIGVAYSEPDIIALSFALRLLGKRVVMMTASKFDDLPRRALKEWGKRLLLSIYSAAIVGGGRQHDYVRFLGFRRRRVLPGYNTVDMTRVRAQAQAGNATHPVAFADRAFVFVGRFVGKKNIEILLEAFALYAAAAGSRARKLEMIGDGPELAILRARCAQLGIDHLVVFSGFLPAPQVAVRLAAGLALVLVSGEEQWGLVINEALAVGLPIIASYEVGAREALVRNLINGFVVQSGSVASIAAALERCARSEAYWTALSTESSRRSWLADSERFADAVELMIWPDAEPARSDHARFAATILHESARHVTTEA